MNTFIKAFVTIALVAAVSPAVAQRTLDKGLVGNGGGQPTVVPITTGCGSVASCNALISKCAEWGGVWSESRHDGLGRPTKGACVN